MAEPTCKDLQNAVNELCKKGEETLLNAETITLDNGNTYIALESTGLLQELGEKIIALKSSGTIDYAPPDPKPPSASEVAPVDIVSQFSKYLDIDLLKKRPDLTPDLTPDQILMKLLEEFKLEDIVKTDDVSGKADKTVQVAIASNNDEFVKILSYEIEKDITHSLDIRTDSELIIRINKIKKMFEYVRFITNGQDYNDEINLESQDYLFRGYFAQIDKDITSKLVKKDEDVRKVNEYLSTSLNSNSKLHNEETDVENLYFLTIAIESQMIFALIFLKRILLLLYQNFEIRNGDDKYKPEKLEPPITKENPLYKYETQKLLNEKLDEFFKMKLNYYLHIREPIDIKVDDGYAPNKIDDNFSSWRIEPEITVFDLISIIKSMSVYLRLQL